MNFLEFFNHVIAYGALTAFATLASGLISVIIVDKLDMSMKYRDMVCCSVVAATIITSSYWYWT